MIICNCSFSSIWLFFAVLPFNWLFLLPSSKLFLVAWPCCVSWQPYGITVCPSGWPIIARTSLCWLYWKTAWTGLSGLGLAALQPILQSVAWLPWVESSSPSRRSKNLKNPLSLLWTCSTKRPNGVLGCLWIFTVLGFQSLMAVPCASAPTVDRNYVIVFLVEPYL